MDELQSKSDPLEHAGGVAKTEAVDDHAESLMT